MRRAHVCMGGGGKQHIFCTFVFFFCSGCGSFLAHSTAGHARASRVHYGTSVAPSGAPWRVLLASEVARDRSFSRDCAPPRRVKQGHGNIKMCMCLFDVGLLLYLKYPISPQRLYKSQYTDSRTSSYSLCDSHEQILWVCAILGSYSSTRD